MEQELKPTQVKDAEGELWTCRMDTATFSEASRALGITIAEISNPERMNIGVTIELLWFCLKRGAAARGITKAEFYEKRFPLHMIGDAIAAVGAAISEAFNGPETEQKSNPTRAAEEAVESGQNP